MPHPRANPHADRTGSAQTAGIPGDKTSGEKNLPIRLELHAERAEGTRGALRGSKGDGSGQD